MRKTSCRTIGFIIAALTSAKVVETFGKCHKKNSNLDTVVLWKEADKQFLQESIFKERAPKVSHFMLLSKYKKNNM